MNVKNAKLKDAKFVITPMENVKNVKIFMNPQ